MSRKKKIMQQRMKEEAARKALERQKKGRIAFVIFAGVVCGIIIGAIIFDAVNEKESVVNYSVGLNEDGTIKNVSVSENVSLADLDSMSRDYTEYLPEKETEDTYIDAMLESYPLLDDEAGVEIKEGDRISIDFIGYVDGEEYEGGNTNNAGISMVVGSEGYPGDFEQQIIGHKTGETFDVTVDYDEAFSNEVLAGKTVLYKVTVNGMLVKSEFNDEFVAENFGSYVSSADEFLEMYRKSAAETSYDEEILSYLEDNSTVASVPNSYLTKLAKLEKQKDLKMMDTTNDAYINMYGSAAYQSIYDMKQMSEDDYEKDVEKRANEAASKAMIIQAAIEKYNIEVTEDDINSVLSSYSYEPEEYDTAVERFGEPYIKQMAMEKALETYLKDNYNLSEE